MNKYIGTVTLAVEVEAHNESDARDILSDNFDTGEEVGVNVTNYKVVTLELSD